MPPFASPSRHTSIHFRSGLVLCPRLALPCLIAFCTAWQVVESFMRAGGQPLATALTMLGAEIETALGSYSRSHPCGESLWRIPMENPYGESLLQL